MKDDDQANQKQTNSNKINLSLDTRLIILILLVIIAGMLAAWRPWNSTANADDRTISVTGEAKITESPDEYVFNPSYQFKDDKKDVALAAMTKKSEEVVGKLKALGVQDSKIKTDSDGYNYDYYYDELERKSTYSLRLTVTVGTKDLAQKVQDYLVTTEPLGQVTPRANFSDSKRKELENRARDEATKNARAKADQSAKNLNFKVGKVKSIKDGAGFNGDIGILREGSTMSIAADSGKPQSLTLQPGEDNLHYSVSVVYYVK